MLTTFGLPIIIILTIFSVSLILRSFGVFDFQRETSRVVSDIQRERHIAKKRKREQNRLALYASVTETFRGILMTTTIYEDHVYWIQRLELRSKTLNRFLTPEEYRGKYGLIALVGLFFVPIGVFFKPAFVVTAVTLFIFFMYPVSLKQRIEDEDIIIDNNFLNLYLLMYSRLKMGSRARLQNVVESYIETLETEADGNIKETMLKFSRFLLNNLSQYEDHVAIPKLRDRYRNATIINFCNVAGQSLQGVDNSDNLLTFKMMLVERKTLAMKKRSEKIFKSGMRSIYLIWVILIIFIICGWYSKLPFDML